MQHPTADGGATQASLAKPAPRKYKVNCWLRFCDTIERRTEAFLGEVAAFAARRSCMVIVLCMSFVLLCGGGFAFFKIETESDKLWVAQDSVAKAHQAYVQSTYAAVPRMGTSFAVAKPEGANVLTMAAMGEVFDFLEEVQMMRLSGGETYIDVCLPKGSGQGPAGEACVVKGVTRFWRNNATTFRNSVSSDADVVSAVASATYPNGESVYRPDVLADPTLAGGNLTGAALVQVLVLFRGCIEEAGSAVCSTRVPQEAELEFLRLAAKPRQHITIMRATLRSVDDELDRSIGGDIPLMAVAYTIMVGYTCIVMGRFDAVHSRVWVGVGAVFAVMMSTVAGYGLALYFGIPFTTLAQLLPFILIGIGAYDSSKGKSLSIEERCRLALRKCGMSVALTSITDALAFALGSFTVLPAVHFFCIYAALCIIIDFGLQVTLFVAFLAIDERRQAANRYDTFCCCKRQRKSRIGGSGSTSGPGSGAGVELAEVSSANVLHADVLAGPKAQTSAKDSFLQRFMRDIYGPFLMKTWVKVVCVLLFLCLIAGCTVGVVRVKSGFRLTDITPDDSYLRDYLDYSLKYYNSLGFGSAVDVGLYFLEADYHDPDIQRRIIAAEDSVDASEYIEYAITSWLQAYKVWVASQPTYAAYITSDGYFDGSTSATAQAAFYDSVSAFLAHPQLGRFNADVVWKDGDQATHVIVGTRALYFIKNVGTTAEELSAMRDITGRATSANVAGSFAFSFDFVFWTQFDIILEELLTNFGWCLVAVSIVCALILVHPKAIVLLVVVVALIDYELLGSLWFWGLEVNSVTVINLIMALGLTVDLSAHLIHNFGRQSLELPANDRVIAALGDIGPAVLKGGFTTLLALVPLAFSSSDIFRTFFKCFLCIVGYGVAHGLVLVPIIISVVPSLANHRKHLYKWRASQGDGVDNDLREQQPATDAGAGVISAE